MAARRQDAAVQVLSDDSGSNDVNDDTDREGDEDSERRLDDGFSVHSGGLYTRFELTLESRAALASPFGRNVEFLGPDLRRVADWAHGTTFNGRVQSEPRPRQDLHPELEGKAVRFRVATERDLDGPHAWVDMTHSHHGGAVTGFRVFVQGDAVGVPAVTRIVRRALLLGAWHEPPSS